MKILLRENNGKVWALDPETEGKVTKIVNPSTWCDGDNPDTGYTHPGGIYWHSWEYAREALINIHEIIILETPTINSKPDEYDYEIVEDADDLPAETPIINRAKFDPANILAENMTVRQVYKCSAMEALTPAGIIGFGWDYDGDPAYSSNVKTSSEMLSKAVGRLADAMIEEDKQHEALSPGEEGK